MSPRRSPWWGHLRLKVLAFGIAMSVLPLAIYGWYGLMAARSAQWGMVQAQNQAAARTVAADLAQFVTQLTTQLELLARVEGAKVVTYPMEEQERILYTLLRDVRYLEEVTLVDGDGRELARASRREVVAGSNRPSHAGTPHWESIRQGRSFVGEVTIDMDGRPLFTVGVPLPNRAGALVARPTLRGLVNNIAAVQAGGTTRLHVIDGAGRLIGDSDFSLVLAGYRLQSPEHPDLIYRSVTGEEAIGFSAPVPGLPWKVVGETTVSAGMAPVRRLAAEFAVGALFLMVVVVGLSIVAGLQLTVPLERLEAGTRRVGAGDLSVRIETGGRDELGRLVTAFNAMTERLQAQGEDLRAERDRLDTAVTAIGAGMALIDANGKILWTNRRLAEWFPGAMDGERCWEQMGRPTCHGFCAACTPDGGEHPVVVDGRTRWLRYRTYPLNGGQGEPARLEVLEDVTERRSMEQMVLQSEKLAAVGQLAAGVAHEINNPLAVISAYAEDLSDRLKEEGAEQLESSGELNGYLTQLQVQVQRCKSITMNLLDFARHGPVEPEPVNLTTVALATASLAAPRARKAGIDLRVEAPADLPPVRASRDQLQQVFLNLVTNAVDAMEVAGGRLVRITAVQEGELVRVAVSDDGPGMPPEVRERALEPFFTTKPPGKGTGLGLAMCYGIITNLGGQMWIESDPGAGTQVFFELPVWGDEA